MVAKKLATIRNDIDKFLYIFYWECITRAELSVVRMRHAKIKSRDSHSPNRKYLFCKRIRALYSGSPCASHTPSTIKGMEMESNVVGRNRNADFSIYLESKVFEQLVRMHRLESTECSRQRFEAKSTARCSYVRMKGELNLKQLSSRHRYRYTFCPLQPIDCSYICRMQAKKKKITIAFDIRFVVLFSSPHGESVGVGY